MGKKQSNPEPPNIKKPAPPPAPPKFKKPVEKLNILLNR